jgi:hypothetical protein
MKNNLNKLNKTELLNIISKMNKKDLIDIINNKIGGEIISKTKDAIRQSIKFNKEKAKINNVKNVMANDKLYNKIYE